MGVKNNQSFMLHFPIKNTAKRVLILIAILIALQFVPNVEAQSCEVITLENNEIVNLGDCEATYTNSQELFKLNIQYFNTHSLLTNFLIKEYTTSYFNSITTNINGNYVLIDRNNILWTNEKNLITLEFRSDYQEILNKYLEDFPSDLGANLDETILSSKNLEREEQSQISYKALASSCSECGDGLFDICEEHECLALGACYFDFWSIQKCKDAPPLGDGDYCKYKAQVGNGCDHGEWHCDSNSECSGYLVCDAWDLDNDGCCNANDEEWNGNTHQCEQVCDEGYSGDLKCEGDLIKRKHINSDCIQINKLKLK